MIWKVIDNSVARRCSIGAALLSFIVALIAFSPLAASAAVTAVIKTDGFGLTGMAPFSKSFTAASSTGSDGLTTSIVRQEWDFADDNSAHGFPRYMHGNMANHRWESAGTSTITLTVYDNTGASGSASLQIVARDVPGSAKNYYLDAVSGNDSNTGLSPAQAWKSIDKLTRMYPTFNGGDSILFKAGQTFDTWNNRSVQTFNGIDYPPGYPGVWALSYRDAYNSYNNADTLLRNPPYLIRLGSYGTGAKPIIQSASSSAESIDLATMMIQDLSGVHNGMGVIIDGLDIRGTLWIDSFKNGFGTGDVPGLLTILRNSRVGTYGGAGHYIQWAGTGIIENSEVDLSGNADNDVVAVGTANNPAFFTMSSSTVHNSGDHCVYLSGASISSLLINNDIHSCGSVAHFFDGITAHGFQNDLNIVGNNIYNAYFCMGLDANQSPLVEYLNGVVVDRNKCHDMTSHVFQFRSVKNLKVTNNQIYNISGADQPVFWFEGNGALQPNSNVEIYNNTIVINSAGVIGVDYVAGKQNTADIRFKNNIVSTTPNVKLITDARPYTGFATSSFLNMDYNSYYGANAGVQVTVSTTVNYTLSQWLAQMEPHSANGVDPQFVDLAHADFRLKGTSTLIAAGANVNVAYDYNSILRSVAAPSLGALEFYDSAAPTNIGVSTIAADAFGQLTVTAMTAADMESGLNISPYWFQETSGHAGGASSLSWQASTAFINNGLSPNTMYTYQVKARDAYNNESDFSAETSKYTLTPTPTNLAVVVGSAAVAVSVDPFVNDSSGLSGYYFSRDGANSGWIQTNSWVDTSFNCNTAYTYSVIYRNGDGDVSQPITLSGMTGACQAQNNGGGAMPVAWLSPPVAPTGGFQIALADGAKTVSDPTVTLDLKSDGDTVMMALSNNPDFTGASQEAYQTKKVWNLCAGSSQCNSGTKTVYVKFFTRYGQPSNAVSVSVSYAGSTSLPVLIRYADSPRVYLVENNLKRWFPSKKIFFALGYNSNDIKIIPVSQSYADGPDMIGPTGESAVADPSIIRYLAGPEVYLLAGSLKHWIVSKKIFFSLAFQNKDILTLPPEQSFPAGSDINDAAVAASFFTKDLKSGVSDPQVKLLQQRLNKLGFNVALKGLGSSGQETTKFGAATKAAVIKFQKKYGLEATGEVNGATRSQLNKLFK